MKEKILELLEQKSDLPPLPDIVLRLQKMVRDPNSNARKIAGMIEVEPVLAGRIINLSNSVYYARSTEKVKSLPVAVTKIGINTLVKLVYSLEMTSLFSDNSILDSTQFWRHSLAVAIFTQSLSSLINASQEEQDIAYLAGLMHDVGIIVFGYLIPDDYVDFLLNVQNDEESLENQEYKEFGIDHSELGSYFIKKWWEMDENVTRSVQYHHYPLFGMKNYKRYEIMVNVSNSICNKHEILNGVNAFHGVFKEDTWEVLGLSLDEVEDIMKNVNTSLEQAEELIK